MSASSPPSDTLPDFVQLKDAYLQHLHRLIPSLSSSPSPYPSPSSTFPLLSKALQSVSPSSSIIEADRKAALELAFRQQAVKMVKELKMHADKRHLFHPQPLSGTSSSAAAASSSPPASLSLLLDLCISCASSSFLDAASPFQLLEDVLEYVPLSRCPSLFSLLLDRSAVLASPAHFPDRAKLVLLRICNALMRRLSKTGETKFCGTILQVMAYMCSIDDRSGVNVAGKFNLETVKPVDKAAEAQAQASAAAGGEVVDLPFYRSLWSLQTYCYEPVRLKLPADWNQFTHHVDAVLSAFESAHLTNSDALSTIQTSLQTNTFPKYLTSTRLMRLQLQDVNFRRQICMQLLVLFQHLNGTAVTGDKGQTLPTDTPLLGVTQLQTLKGIQSRVNKLLKSLPPSSSSLASDFSFFLSREVNWIKWKGIKAPKLQLPAADLSRPISLPSSSASSAAAKRAAKFKPMDFTSMYGSRSGSGGGSGAESKRTMMGSEDLAKLWSAEANLAVCADESRDFLPKLQTYLVEPLVEEEKDQDIGEEEKRKNDPRFAWKAIRLIAQTDIHLLIKSEGNMRKLVDECKSRQAAAAATAAAASATHAANAASPSTSPSPPSSSSSSSSSSDVSSALKVEAEAAEAEAAEAAAPLNEQMARLRAKLLEAKSKRQQEQAAEEAAAREREEREAKEKATMKTEEGTEESEEKGEEGEEESQLVRGKRRVRSGEEDEEEEVKPSPVKEEDDEEEEEGRERREKKKRRKEATEADEGTADVTAEEGTDAQKKQRSRTRGEDADEDEEARSRDEEELVADGASSSSASSVEAASSLSPAPSPVRVAAMEESETEGGEAAREAAGRQEGSSDNEDELIAPAMEAAAARAAAAGVAATAAEPETGTADVGSMQTD